MKLKKHTETERAQIIEILGIIKKSRDLSVQYTNMMWKNFRIDEAYLNCFDELMEKVTNLFVEKPGLTTPIFKPLIYSLGPTPRFWLMGVKLRGVEVKGFVPDVITDYIYNPPTEPEQTYLILKDLFKITDHYIKFGGNRNSAGGLDQDYVNEALAPSLIDQNKAKRLQQAMEDLGIPKQSADHLMEILND